MSEAHHTCHSAATRRTPTSQTASGYFKDEGSSHDELAKTPAPMRIGVALVATIAALTIGIGGTVLWRRAPRPGQLLQAAADGDSVKVATLLDKGTSLESTDGWNGTALMYAAGNGHDAIVKMLLDRGANVNEQRRLQRTAMMWAAYGGHTQTVRLLLSRGARADLRDAAGETAFTLAAKGGHSEVAKLLREEH
jgi:hypothetical protein